MKLLEERIRKDGIVKEGNVLKVDSFLNHQMDIELFNQMGAEWARLFADCPVTKILTVEASGIGIACVAAQHFHVPVVFAKKAKSLNIDGEVYATKIQSFTHKRVYDVKWEKVLEEPEDIVFAATPDHPLAQRDEPLELDEILSYPFVLTEKDASYRLLLEQYLAAMGKHLDPYLEIGNTDFILQFLRQNTGVTFLPHFTVERSVKEGYLRILPVKRFAIRTWRQLLYHKDKWVTREMAEFIKLAQELS